MAKRISSILIAVLFIFSSTAALCDVAAKHWEFSKSIRVLDYSKKAAAIPLDRQVYDSAKADLSDLRIVDEKGQECPYAFFTQGEVKKEKKLKAVILSTQINKTESVITAELKEPLTPFNSIKIIPEGSNFARKITIEGSNDNRTWEMIRKGSVVHAFAFQITHRFFEQYTNEVYEGYGFGRYSEEKLWVQFPEANYRFVRATVPHGLDKEPVEVKDLEIFRTIKINAEEDVFSGKIIKRMPGAESKCIENIVDFGSKDIPLSRIDLATGQSNFFRRVEVEGSNDLAKWAGAASGVIFSISVDEEPEQNLTIRLGDAKFRYLKIKVFNGDNKPIRLESVTGHGLKRFLVMIPEKGLQYKLLYGNPGAKSVSYDLGEVIRGKMIDNFGRGALNAQIRNDKYVPYKEAKPWTEERPYILWVTMIVIILGLIFLGSQVIKKMDNTSK